MARRRSSRAVERPTAGQQFMSFAGTIPAWVAAITIVGGIAGFYFKTDYAINDLKTGRDKDNTAREELRKALTDNSNKTQDAISTLVTHAALQDERTKTISESLGNIKDQLTALSAVNVVAPHSLVRPDAKPK
jgi:hypothetical protein